MGASPPPHCGQASALRPSRRVHEAVACVLFLGALARPASGLEMASRGAPQRRGGAAGAGCAFAPPLAGGLGALGKRVGVLGLSSGREAAAVPRGTARVCASLSAGDIGGLGRGRERGGSEGARLGGKTLGSRTVAFAAAVLVGSVSLSAPKPAGAAAQVLSDRGAIVRVVDEGTQGRVGGRAMLAFVDEFDDEDDDMLEEEGAENQAMAVQEDPAGLVQHQVLPKLLLLGFRDSGSLACGVGLR